MFIEDTQQFFNVDDFAAEAWINGLVVHGILETAVFTLNQVQGYTFRFTCAQAGIPAMRVEDSVRILDQIYHILEIKPDGTGLLSLTLEPIA